MLFFICYSFLKGYGHTDDELTDCYVEEASPSITSPIVTTTRLRTRGQSPMRKFSIPRHLNLGLSPFGEAPVEESPIRKESKNNNKVGSRRAHQTEHAVEMNIENTSHVSELKCIKKSLIECIHKFDRLLITTKAYWSAGLFPLFLYHLILIREFHFKTFILINTYNLVRNFSFLVLNPLVYILIQLFNCVLN